MRLRARKRLPSPVPVPADPGQDHCARMESRVAARKTKLAVNARGMGILSDLGVVGCEAIEPVILAALANAEPLLLVGGHGTGKSFLLNRLSAALGLEHRHYNASLISFDDLVGYPLPDDSGNLRYIQTPATIWGAQAVFFDEISRCRPEMQNKLFSIIHERRVQGVTLDRLTYRWSAMNPPAADEDVAEYAGSEPLDRALADRFALIAELPDWDGLSTEQQERVVLTDDRAEPGETAIQRLRTAVAAIQRMTGGLRRAVANGLSVYVRVVCSLLRQAGLDMTPRRAAILFRNVVGVHAARLQADPRSELKDSAFLALTNSLCQRAYGKAVPAMKLGAAHKQAWSSTSMDKGAEFEALLTEPDPVKRVEMAVALTKLPKAEFSTIVADCLASVDVGARYALAVELCEGPGAERLVAAVAEQCGELYRLPCSPQGIRESVWGGSARHAVWKHIVSRLAALEPNTPETARTHNLLVGLFAKKQIESVDEVDEIVSSWMRVRNGFGKVRA